ncbi:hypothetical protein Tco_1374393 [Tanacetum coccineum]
MATIRHDGSATVNSQTPTQHPRRIFACTAEKEGPGSRTCQRHLSRGTKMGGGRDYARSLLPRLAIQPVHGKEARW